MTTHLELIERLNKEANSQAGQYGGDYRAELLREAAEELSTLTSIIAGSELDDGSTTEATFWQDECHRKNGVIREMATYSQQLLSERGEDELVNDLCLKIYQLARGEHATD